MVNKYDLMEQLEQYWYQWGNADTSLIQLVEKIHSKIKIQIEYVEDEMFIAWLVEQNKEYVAHKVWPQFRIMPIDDMLDNLYEFWKAVPEWRFLQMYSNIRAMAKLALLPETDYGLLTYIKLKLGDNE